MGMRVDAIWCDEQALSKMPDQSENIPHAVLGEGDVKTHIRQKDCNGALVGLRYSEQMKVKPFGAGRLGLQDFVLCS